MTETTASVVQRQRQEHAEIEEFTSKVLAVLADRHEVPARVIRLIESLHERVTAHFSDEEEDGILARLTAYDPLLSAECRQLCDEHAPYREELDQLLAVAQNAAATPEWWGRLETRFRDFSRDMLDHENRESDLVERAVAPR